jgi:ribosomal protein S18 acetylase RimI-like enzyme
MISAPPFRAERFDLGETRDHRSIAIAPVTPVAAIYLGSAIAAIGPWRHYAFGSDALTKGFLVTGDGAIRYQVLVDDEPAGAMIIRCPWLLGPYLTMLAVLPMFQGQKVGDALLGWYETTARDANLRNIWLCVTGFNVEAQRFYRAHGWQQVGLIPGMVRTGDDELLMRKQIAD